MENDRIVMGDLLKMEKRKSGRVVMDDLPRWRNCLIVMENQGWIKLKKIN